MVQGCCQSKAAAMLLTMLGCLFLDEAIREFLSGLEDKFCDNEDMAMHTGLEHWKNFKNYNSEDGLVLLVTTWNC